MDRQRSNSVPHHHHQCLFAFLFPPQSSLSLPKPLRYHFIASQCSVITFLPRLEFYRGNASRLILQSTVNSDRLVIVTSRESLPTTSSLSKPSRIGSLRPVHPAWSVSPAEQIRPIHRRQSVVTAVPLYVLHRSCDGRESSVHDVHAVDSHCHPFYPSTLRISPCLLPDDNFISSTDNRCRGSPAKPLPVLDPFADHHHYNRPPVRPSHEGRADDNNAIRHGVSAEWFQRSPFTGHPAEEA